MAENKKSQDVFQQRQIAIKLIESFDEKISEPTDKTITFPLYVASNVEEIANIICINTNNIDV